jgi:4-hydroxy-3-polyprenylbenzoate decarboxylase
MGFGGKMCIDGTTKFEEEREKGLDSAIGSLELDNSVIKDRFSEVHIVNTSLLQKEIPVLIISVEKTRRGHIRELHQQICEMKELEGVKMILYVEHTVDANDLTVALWRFCNNLDPKRDSYLYRAPLASYSSCMGLDGTIKTKDLDNFQRDWPNIIVMDDDTIRAVDEKWSRLGVGKFLSSPSLKFKGQIYGEEAVVS